jgi:TatA/E family protein of Tat protein translocase
MLDFIKNISPIELIIIVLVVVIFFGSRKIASLGKTGGETVKEIKKIKKEITQPFEEIKKEF